MTTDLTVDTPNLDALLAEYGMTRQEGLVIETTATIMLTATADLPAAEPELQRYHRGRDRCMYVFTPVAQGIVKGDSTDDLTLTTLLRHQQHGLFHAGHRRAGGKRSQRPL